MEDNIQNEECSTDEVMKDENKVNDLPDSQGMQEESEESLEEKSEKTFKNAVEIILNRIKSLPSEATELKVPKTSNTSLLDVYKKLCKALKVPENSTVLTQTESEKMDFSYQCLGPAGIIPVAKSLILCQTLKTLDLKYNNLGVESLPAITLLIDQNENISHLNLTGNGIGKGSSQMLDELISRCFSVEYLDLSNNNLGDEELPEIGLSLMKVDTVKELVLNTNDFSSAKAPQFGSYINKCSALLKLDLSRCHLEEGATNIFAGLKFSNLTYLNLARNGIPDAATQALASGLRGNKSLQELDLSYNVISNKGAVTLAPGLRGSSTLEIMRLAHNPIQGSAATTLLSSAGGNLKLLDLSGIRVNLAFFKTLRTYSKTGRDVKVLFGSEIRYDLFPRDLTMPVEEFLSKDNALTYLEKFADEKGVSLRNTLKNMHASFIADQHAAFTEEQTTDKKGDKKKPEKTTEKKGKAKKPEKVPEEKDNKKERPEMTTEELARRLVSSVLAVPKAVAQDVAVLLSEDGHVNMWSLIARIRWKPDDLNVKIKLPKTGPVEKKKDKDKKKKK